MLHSKLSALVLLVCMHVSGCSNDTAPLNKASESSPSSNNQTLTDTQKDLVSANKDKLVVANKSKQVDDIVDARGTVIYQTIEGGFFSFITDDGAKYTPTGLPKAHRQHGMVLHLKGKIMRDMMTTTQFGEVLRVSSSTLIDASQVKSILPSEKDI